MKQIHYVVISIDEAVERKLDTDGYEADDYGYILYRIENGEYYFVGTDHAEPEDKSLVRDFDWVSLELNRLAEERNDLIKKISQ